MLGNVVDTPGKFVELLLHGIDTLKKSVNNVFEFGLRHILTSF
jgi:hypothetical protein